jgi:TetR/AcrR family transcriptional regulator, regulator of biofilm formation and stress response
MVTEVLAPNDSAKGRPDGRRLRGDASRRAILAAATQVIVERGVAGVTHRAVAEAAGVPLARVSYHFARVDDLLLAAARQYLEGFDARLGRLAEECLAGRRPVLDACTDFLHELVTVGSREFLAVVEVRLALHARGQVVDDTAVVDIVGSFGLDDTRAASIVAAIFGVAVLAATAAEAPGRVQIRAILADVLGVAA